MKGSVTNAFGGSTAGTGGGGGGGGGRRLTLREEAALRAAGTAAQRGMTASNNNNYNNSYDDDDDDYHPQPFQSHPYQQPKNTGTTPNNHIMNGGMHMSQQHQQQQQQALYAQQNLQHQKHQQHPMAQTCPPPSTMTMQQQQHQQPNSMYSSQQHPVVNHVNNGRSTIPNNTSTTSPIDTTTASKARDEWKKFGTALTQAFEDVRLGNTQGIVARIVSAETRIDQGGSSYTTYIVRVVRNPNQTEIWIERRYSDFDKLYNIIRETTINNSTVTSTTSGSGRGGTSYAGRSQLQLLHQVAFPSKHWAGRLGAWTPSKLLAPTKHDQLIEYRCQQLDIWLTHIIQLYTSEQLHPLASQHVYQFLFATPEELLPCQRRDVIFTNNTTAATASGTTVSTTTTTIGAAASPSKSTRSMLNYLNPVSFTLGSALRQAKYILESMTQGGGGVAAAVSDDKSIPLDLLQSAQGLAFLTVAKAGCIVSGRVGTGLVLAKLDDDNNNNNNTTVNPQQPGGTNTPSSSSSSSSSLSNRRWSAPCAIGTIGIGWGALVGGDVTHYLVVLTTKQAVHDLVNQQKSVQLGAELGVALGPMGRNARGTAQTGDWTIHPAYSYAHSQGFFAGVSLEGAVVAVRHDVNAKFYGRPTDGTRILQQPGPPAAEPLYESLNIACSAKIPDGAFRPTQFFQPQTPTPIMSSSSLQQQYQQQQQQSNQQQAPSNQQYVVVDNNSVDAIQYRPQVNPTYSNNRYYDYPNPVPNVPNTTSTYSPNIHVNTTANQTYMNCNNNNNSSYYAPPTPPTVVSAAGTATGMVGGGGAVGNYYNNQQ